MVQLENEKARHDLSAQIDSIKKDSKPSNFSELSRYSTNSSLKVFIAKTEKHN